MSICSFFFCLFLFRVSLVSSSSRLVFCFVNCLEIQKEMDVRIASNSENYEKHFALTLRYASRMWSAKFSHLTVSTLDRLLEPRTSTEVLDYITFDQGLPQGRRRQEEDRKIGATGCRSPLVRDRHGGGPSHGKAREVKTDEWLPRPSPVTLLEAAATTSQGKATRAPKGLTHTRTCEVMSLCGGNWLQLVTFQAVWAQQPHLDVLLFFLRRAMSACVSSLPCTEWPILTTLIKVLRTRTIRFSRSWGRFFFGSVNWITDDLTWHLTRVQWIDEQMVKAPKRRRLAKSSWISPGFGRSSSNIHRQGSVHGCVALSENAVGSGRHDFGMQAHWHVGQYAYSAKFSLCRERWLSLWTLVLQVLHPKQAKYHLGDNDYMWCSFVFVDWWNS